MRYRMKRMLVAILALVGLAAFSREASANWRWTNAGCTWDQNTDGPDECDPNLPLGDVPQAAPDTVPQVQGNLASPEGAQFGSEGDLHGVIAIARGSPVSCRAYTKQGDVGYISVQTDPVSGSLTWGAYMNNVLYDYGWWSAQIYVNGGPSWADTKNQLYPPHASLQMAQAPPGSTIFITVQHLYFQWGIVPVYIGGDAGFSGWTFAAEWIPSVAYGTLTCIMPFGPGF